MADMTLQQVSNGIKSALQDIAQIGRDPSPITMAGWADAIGAHLAGIGEPVLIGWLEAEPSATIESLAVYGRFVHSTMVHIGATRPEKRQERNGMFPLYTAPPASADVASLQSRLAAADALLSRCFVQIGELTKGLNPHDPIYVELQQLGLDWMQHSEADTAHLSENTHG